MFSMLGNYGVFIPNLFVKFELFFVLSTIFEVPFLFYFYVSQMKVFWTIDLSSNQLREQFKSKYSKHSRRYATVPTEETE